MSVQGNGGFGQSDPTAPPQSGPGQRLFLSYGHDSNEPLVHRLAGDLRARGFDVWIDSQRIRTGDEWRDAITRALLDSDRVLSFLSRHSVRDPGVCLDELRIALCVRTALINTVLLEAEEEVSVPTTLSEVQWLDMSDWRRVKDESPAAFEKWYREKLDELCATLTSGDAQALNGEIESLRRLLRPSLADAKERRLLAPDYVGRQWLREELERWRQDAPEDQAFVVFGGPGTGKSRFLAEELHYNPHVLCGVFCDASRDAPAGVKGVLNTIAFRLAARLPDYRSILLATLRHTELDALRGVSDSEYFDALLTYPLTQLIDGGRDRYLLVIDGLDELESGGVNDLADVLADGLQRLPGWLRLVLTSRPESSVVAAFSGMHPRYLGPGDERSQLDVRQYLAVRLQPHLAQEEMPAQLLERIVRNAEGNFLYAKLLCDAAAQPGFNIADPENYPVGLESYYRKSFRRRFPSASAYAPVRAILEVLVAQHPCPVGVLRDASGSSEYELQDALRALGSLLVVQETTFSEVSRPIQAATFSHKSIADWLVSPRSNQFFVSINDGRRRLAEALLREFDQGASRMLPVGPADSRKDVGSPELEFRQISVTRAAARAGMWTELEAFLLDPRTPLWPYWRAVGDFPPYYDIARLLDVLWESPDRESFFHELRRVGDRTLAVDILAQLLDRHTHARDDLGLANAYVDALHLNGRYVEAVSVCDSYLEGLPLAEITSDLALLNMYIRRLHHLMFYRPVDPLLDEATALVPLMDAERFPDAYNELIFLIGGNLGVLSGDFRAARPWLDRSRDFARSRGSRDYETRALRKHAELLAAEGHVDAAYAVARSAVREPRHLQTRYEVYLLGVRGELARQTGHTSEAFTCFNELGMQAGIRGIPGWLGHSYLGLAALSLDLRNVSDGLAYAQRAEEQYEYIGQVWGQIATGIVRLLLRATSGDANAAEFAQQAHTLRQRAAGLNYRYEAGVLAQFVAGLPNTAVRLRLNFL